MPRLSMRNVESNRIDRNRSRTHDVRFQHSNPHTPTRPALVPTPSTLLGSWRATCGRQEPPKSPRLAGSQDGSPPREEKRPEATQASHAGYMHFFESSHGSTGTRAGKREATKPLGISSKRAIAYTIALAGYITT